MSIFHDIKTQFDRFFNRDKPMDQNKPPDSIEDEIIKRDVEILSIKDEKGNLNFQYKFEFDFIKEDNKKKAVIYINDEKVILEDGQSCIFALRSGDFSFRLKVIPDFKKESCNTIACMDSNIKDEDI